MQKSLKLSHSHKFYIEEYSDDIDGTHLFLYKLIYWLFFVFNLAYFGSIILVTLSVNNKTDFADLKHFMIFIFNINITYKGFQKSFVLLFKVKALCRTEQNVRKQSQGWRYRREADEPLSSLHTRDFNSSLAFLVRR